MNELSVIVEQINGVTINEQLLVTEDNVLITIMHHSAVTKVSLSRIPHKSVI